MLCMFIHSHNSSKWHLTFWVNEVMDDTDVLLYECELINVIININLVSVWNMLIALVRDTGLAI